ncbi:MAG TPA: MASE1 domain-containing protein [Thermoanaerobaculia bacterium]
MTPTRRESFGRHVLVTLGVALLYVACAKLGLAMAVRAAEVSAVWPPTGFALAAVVLMGRRVVPGVLLGAFVANAATGQPLWVAAGIATGNTLEAIAGAAILFRLRFDTSLARVRDVMLLIAAVALASCVSATIGVAFLVAGGLHPVSAASALWPVWWIGDALGGLIVTPLLLVWARGDQGTHARGLVERASMLGGIVLVASIVFSLPPGFPAAYMVYPFLIWAALRLGPAYTTTASLLVNAIAVAGTLTGHGPFAGAGPERGLVLVQCFMAVGATTALIVAVTAAQSRAAHERADRNEQRLRMAMAGARVGVWEWNIQTGELVWTEALEPMHGMPQGGFAGTYEAFREAIHPEDLERVETLIANSVETRVPYEAEFRLLGRDGVVRWTSARAIVVDEAGRPARMVGVGVDVTHLKELEKELRLEHRRKDEFLAMLGHELRNPLAAIVHAVELLWSDDPEEVEGARRVIRRQTRSMSRLIDELLDLSRISRGQITLERQRLALANVVSAGVDVWRHLVSQKRQRLTVEASNGPLWVDGDATRLTQVFANLVHNASKFTPEGGAIVITLSGHDGTALVAVRDEGEGMAPEVLAHVFELFVQGPPTLDRQQGGLGLGLTLVRRLVEMHGGSVEASSAGPGCGSEVVVRLSLTEPNERDGVDPDPVQSDAPTRRRRVLVVEDNADAREMLVIILKRAGHDVRAASDGLEGITAAESFVPEIVLLDIGLPGLDGYGVARRLRASHRTSEVQLVALTGYGQEEDREKALAAGFDHHLLKPVEPAAVLALVGREWPRRGSRSSGDME